MKRIFVSLEPYYFDCYEEGGRKRRRTLVFSGVIKDIIKGVTEDIAIKKEGGGRKTEEERRRKEDKDEKV